MVKIKTLAEISRMREVNRLVANVLLEITSQVRVGVTTACLDEKAEILCHKMGGAPAFKNYGGFPFSLCCSVNNEVVHGFPRCDPLEDGDILSVDFGAVLDGFYGDSAVTVSVGKISKEASNLIKVTKASLQAGIEKMSSGGRLGDVSFAIQKVVEDSGFSVVRRFVGHGIGRSLHEEPQVPNYGSAGRGLKLREGLVIAIEPMVNVGEEDVRVLEDGWTVVTVDGKLSAHFEHSVAITENGPLVLSLP